MSGNRTRRWKPVRKLDYRIALANACGGAIAVIMGTDAHGKDPHNQVVNIALAVTAIGFYVLLVRLAWLFVRVTKAGYARRETKNDDATE